MKTSRIIKITLFLILLIGIGIGFFRNPSVKQSESTLEVQPTTAPIPLDKSDIQVSSTGNVPTPSVPALQVLEEIFESKNDNDPRMDTVLKNLSPDVKNALIQKYSKIKAENRNERGTVVFIIGREVKEGRGSSADLDFLKSVLLEKPCQSLNDCSKPNTDLTPEDHHHEAITDTTADYPQLMALRSLRQALENSNLSTIQREQIISQLQALRHSPHPRVVEEVEKILSRY